MKTGKILVWVVLAVFAGFIFADEGFCSKITPSKGAIEFQNTLVDAAKSIKPSVVSILVEIGEKKKIVSEPKGKKQEDKKKRKEK